MAALPVRSGRPRVALLVALCLIVGACRPSPVSPPTSSPSSTATPSPNPVATVTAAPVEDIRSLRYAIERDPVSITPGFTEDAEGELVVDALFDSLTALTDRLEVVPSAAASWSSSPDLRTWTFTLRPGARFHDGLLVTALDFVRSFSRIVDGTQPRTSLSAFRLEGIVGFDDTREGGGPLAGVRAVDDRTLVIELEEPDADLPRRLAHPTLGPVPQAAALTPDTFAERPVGNGPFQMAATWEHNQFIRVVRAPEHPDVPGVDEIVFRIYAGSGAQAERDLEAGLLDVAVIEPSSVSEVLARLGRGEEGAVGPGVLDRASTAITYLGVNVDRPPFDDPRLRQAVSLAIDREALVVLTGGTRVPLDGLAPPGVVGAQPGVCGHCRHDPEAARALLEAVLVDLRATAAEEGTEGDEPLDPADVVLPPVVLRHEQGRTTEALVGAIATDLRETLGLEVQVVAAPLADHVAAVAVGDADLFWLGWQGDSSTQSFLEPLGTSGSLDNLTGYGSAVFDALLAEAGRTPSDAARLALRQEAEAVLLGDAPILPVHAYRHRLAVALVVEGFVLRPDGRVDLTAVRVERPT